METRPAIRALKIAGTERSRPYMRKALIMIIVIVNVPQNVVAADSRSTVKRNGVSPFFSALPFLFHSAWSSFHPLFRE